MPQRVLIVDDDPSNVELLKAFLEDVADEIRGVTDSTKAEQTFKEFEPDLMLLDLHMPNPDGLTLLRRLSKVRDNAGYLPVIVLTADNEKAARDTALELEADDFLIKPLDRQEVWAAVAWRGRADPNEPAKDYVRRFVSPAVDRVRSAYRAPGTRSRWRNEMPQQEAPRAVELESIEEHEDEASTAEFQRLEVRLEIEARLTSATTIVATHVAGFGLKLRETAAGCQLTAVALPHGQGVTGEMSNRI